MNKRNMVVLLPIVLALALSGCGDKQPEETPSSTPSSAVEETVVPVAPGPIETPVPGEMPTNNGLENTDAAELEETIKSYNKEVDASNDKAREVIEAYNAKIEPSPGQ